MIAKASLEFEKHSQLHGGALLILNYFFSFKNIKIENLLVKDDLQKQDFLSEEKISDRSRFVNKDVMQS